MSKFCAQCGAENTDEAKFCKRCGEALLQNAGQASKYGGTDEASVTGAGRTAYGENRKSGAGDYRFRGEGSASRKSGGREYAPRGTGKKRNKKLLIGIGAAAAAAVILIVLFLNMGKTLNLTDYIEIRYNGPNGYATAYAELDSEKLGMDAMKSLGYDLNELGAMGLSGMSAIESSDYSNLFGTAMNALGKYPDMMKDMQELESLTRNIEIIAEPQENLQNGDSVKVTVRFVGNPNGKLKIKDGEKSFEVTNLKEVQDIDPFEKLTVTFVGVEPFGAVNVEGMDQYQTYNFDYTIDNQSNLSVGDKVTIRVSYNEENLLNRGYHVTADEKTYTVDKLDEAAGLDLFTGINVSYEGTAPFASAYLEKDSRVFTGTDGSELYVSYEFENRENLDIGDKVVLHAVYDADSFTKSGMAASADTKEYTVSGVDSYIRDPAKISPELLAKMQKECEDKLDAYLAGLGSENYSHSGEKYAGSYCLIKKPSNSSWDPNSRIYLIYTGNLACLNEYSNQRNAEVAYAFEFNDLIELANGTQSVDYSTFRMIEVNNRDLFEWDSPDVYSSVDAAFTDLVVKQKDGYTYMEDMGGAQNTGSGSSSGSEKTPSSEKSASKTQEAAQTATPKPTAAPTQAATPAPAATEAPAQEAESIQIQYGLTAPASDFIFPDSSTRILSAEEIHAALWSDDNTTRRNRSQMAINEIMARYGYAFHPERSDTARQAYDYFESKDWYQAAKPNCAYTESTQLIDGGVISSVEKANIDAINAWQQANVSK